MLSRAYICIARASWRRLLAQAVCRPRARTLAKERKARERILERPAGLAAEMPWRFHAQEQILAHGKIRHDGLAAPILGDESDASADRFRRRAGSERPPFVKHLAAGAGPQPKERLDRLGAPGAD